MFGSSLKKAKRARYIKPAGGVWLLVLLSTLVACKQDPKVSTEDAAPPSLPTALRDAEVSADGATPDAAATDLPQETPDAAAANTLLGLREAIEARRYAAAQQVLSALPEPTRHAPYTRLAAAFVGAQSKNYPACIEELAGLESALPMLTETLAKMRAQCQAEAGQHELALKYFASQSSNAMRLRAARSALAMQDLPQALALASRVLSASKKSRRDEVEAREVRMVAQGNSPSSADALWLVTNAPETSAAQAAALLVFGRGGPGLPTAELATRALKFAESGKHAQALEVVGQVERARPHEARANCRLRADVLYHSRASYMDAASAFQRCAVLARAANKPAEATQSQFLAARSLSRANHDDDAISAFRELSRAHPSAAEAEEAQFLAARLGLLHAKYDEAEHAFGGYLSKYPRASRRQDAQLYSAIAALLANHPKLAREGFERVSDSREGSLGLRAGVLSAMATHALGDTRLALARLAEISQAQPLGYAGMLARAQSKLFGKELTIALESPSFPTEHGAPAAFLPVPIPQLQAVGLAELAREQLRAREAQVGAAEPERPTAALCSAYGALGDGERRVQIAQDIAPELLRTQPGAQTRWAWQCALPEPFDSEVTRSAQESNVDPALIYAVMRVESAYNPLAKSPARAFGLLQLLPETAAAVAKKHNLAFAGEDELLVPAINIRLGARYLQELIEQMHGSVPLAVAAYNAGPEAILRWAGQLGEVPLATFVELIPFAETRAYVVSVLGFWARYAYLRGGGQAVPLLPLSVPKDLGRR